jgi:cytochrome b561
MDARTIEYKKLSGTTRLLHWVSAVLIVAMIPIGVIMQQDGLARPTQDLMFILHKNGGVIVLLLVVLRLIWRAAYPAPPLACAYAQMAGKSRVRRAMGPVWHADRDGT